MNGSNLEIMYPNKAINVFNAFHLFNKNPTFNKLKILHVAKNVELPIH